MGDGGRGEMTVATPAAPSGNPRAAAGKRPARGGTVLRVAGRRRPPAEAKPPAGPC